MSRENVDTLRAGYEAFQKGDLEAALGFIDPEIEVTDHDRTLDTPREYQGPEGVVQIAADAAETFDDHRFEPEGFEAIGDQVMVTVRRRGRGKASGIEVDELQWHLWEFRRGKAVRLRTFVSPDQAREAARGASSAGA